MGDHLEFLQYQERFRAFKAITNEFENVIDWLKSDHFQLGYDQTKTILSIGAGTGSFDLEFSKLFGNVESYTVIEPNVYHIREFMEKTDPEKTFNAAKFIFHNSRFEDFTPIQGYDLAMISHSLYYIEDLNKTLRRVSETAQNTLIFHQTTFGINALQRQFGDGQTLRCVLASEQITECLEKLRLPYSRARIDCHVDVRDISDVNLDFIMEKETSDEERSVIKKHLIEAFPDGRMYHPVDAILIRQDKAN